ncbi:MAG: MaoC/PaaZ C-terminal domain-containing protein [Sulfuricaulis sp.]|nr:MaoC/PaaZ C-terminal domain-containing protein [Sulfuricaulis sp.]
MAIDYDRLMALTLEVRHTYTARDTMLYALGIGLGADPLDEVDLRFVYEKALLALPTLPLVLGYQASWLRESGQELDWYRIVHGEQGLRIHGPVPVQGEVLSRLSVREVVDKGVGKGALIYTERVISDAATGALIATADSTTFCRTEGGFGGPVAPARPVHEMPTREPNIRFDFKTLSQAALIYRLSGDTNPLHCDPALARAVGFERPILHGMCTYGVGAWALTRTVCGGDPSRIAAIDARFSAPVFPGETIVTEIWVDGNDVSFRSRAIERDIVVLSNGRAQLR